MKQQKLSGYKPNYPRKAVKGMALAAAALMALGTSAGCVARRTGDAAGVPAGEPTPGVEQTLPPEEVQLEGYVAPEPEPPVTPGAPLPDITPEPEDLRTGGIDMPEETPEPDGPMTIGYPTLPPEETPEPEDLRTGGVAMPEETPEPEEIMLSGDVAIIDEP